ncbi:MAG: mannitol dehydrogenase family protein [Anaerolineae bacterium]
MRQKAVIFGAGNVGRGFLGQLFSESGYEVVFVDIDQPLIEAMRTHGAYTIRMVSNDSTEQVRVSPVTGILSGDVTAVAEALSEATLGATAVGARVLPYIAPTVAAGITRRAQKGVTAPLNLIVCENLKGAAAIFRGMVEEKLDPASRDYAALNVGFVDTVIGRMVPELPAELRKQDPSLVIVEPYKELPVDRGGFVGPPPPVVGMEPNDNFGLYTARKLYLHNAGHAVLGYLGHLRGYTLGYEALEDPDIRAILDGALEESLRGIVATYGADETWLRAHVTDLKRRFANRVLADPALRLARDPLRKLAPGDRLVGAARVAESAGILPTNLAFVIAAGLRFDAPEDPRAQEMQTRIASEGVEAVLESVCEIMRAEPLGQAVLERYRRIGEGVPWR